MNKNVYYLITFGVGLVGGAGGFFLGHRMGKKSEQARADEEINEVKELYAKRNKVEKFATPEDALNALHGEDGAPVIDAAEFQNYEGIVQNEEYQVRPLTAEITETETNVKTTEFTINGQSPEDYFETHPQHNNVWDAAVDIDGEALAERGTGVPYVITLDEYQEEEESYDKITLVFYGEDGVLVDDHDVRVDNVDYTVGSQNLHRFGMGSKDKSTVYVRNDEREADYEIVLNEGSYSEIVLGVKVAAPKSRPGKMRDDE